MGTKYGYNKQIILGNLGADAELVKVGENNTPKASFRVAATVRTGTNDDGSPREHTEWFNCVMWGKRAEAVAQYLTKGKSVHVEGRTETRSWEDEAGQKHYRTEVRADDLVLLGGGREPAAEGAPGEEASPPNEPLPEIPF
jgi:single-strand DNA-binding protein